MRTVRATTKAGGSAPEEGNEPEKGSQTAPSTFKGRKKRAMETADDEADEEPREELPAKKSKRTVRGTTKAGGSAPKKGKGSR